jgi:hypothetical protein
MLNKLCLGAVLVAAAAGSTTAMANDRGLNTALGAVVGAAIGHSTGARDGAIVGGVLGAAIGNSINASDYRSRSGYVSSDYADGRSYRGPSNYYEPAPTYYEPAPRYYRPAPRYYEPAAVYVEPSYREHYRGRHRGDYNDGWRNYDDRRGYYDRHDYGYRR